MAQAKNSGLEHHSKPIPLSVSDMAAVQIEGSDEIVSVVQPNTSLAYRFTKRFQDIVLTSVGLVVLSPFLLAVAVAIKLEDPAGSILYRQLRTGKDGKPFKCLKFRSMVANADALKDELMDQNEMDGPVFKIRQDPRITKVGRIIRKASVDELPQLINVLRGDMSLVGPRPLPVKEAEGCNSYQRQRETVRPGITCYWQISGRNDVSFGEWMQMDLQYVCKQCFFTDALILFRTIPAVVSSKGAS